MEENKYTLDDLLSKGKEATESGVEMFVYCLNKPEMIQIVRQLKEELEYAAHETEAMFPESSIEECRLSRIAGELLTAENIEELGDEKVQLPHVLMCRISYELNILADILGKTPQEKQFEWDYIDEIRRKYGIEEPVLACILNSVPTILEFPPHSEQYILFIMDC